MLAYLFLGWTRNFPNYPRMYEYYVSAAIVPFDSYKIYYHHHNGRTVEGISIDVQNQNFYRNKYVSAS